jgi:hypothetical protein
VVLRGIELAHPETLGEIADTSHGGRSVSQKDQKIRKDLNGPTPRFLTFLIFL